MKGIQLEYKYTFNNKQMISAFSPSFSIEKAQYDQMMIGFQQFYPELSICSTKVNGTASGDLSKTSPNLTMLTQLGKQLKFTNRYFLLDDCLNSM